MQPPSYLWPFPWWTAVLAVILVTGVPWLVARLRAGRWNRELWRLGSALRQSGMALDDGAFTVGEGKNVLVAEPELLVVTDLKSHRVAQTLAMKQAISLKIYDRPSNEIEFRVVMNGGAQTRRISTRSIAGFGRLFIQFGRAGKPVEYIQS
jgi:hypothetical protein